MSNNVVQAVAQASGYSGGSSGSFPSINLTPTGINRLLLIHLSWFVVPGSEANLPTVDGSSAGIFQVGTTQLINNDRDRHALYALLYPPAQQVTVTATIADTSTNALVIGAVAYSGVNLIRPLGTPAQTSDNSGFTTALSASPSPDYTDANAMVVSSMRSRTPSASVTHGQTLDWEIEAPGGSLLTAAMTHALGSPVAMTHTLDAAAAWMQTAVVLFPGFSGPNGVNLSPEAIRARFRGLREG